MQDLFVATVALIMGVLLLASAMERCAYLLELPTVQRSTARWGHVPTRIVLAGVGTLMIVVSGYLSLHAIRTSDARAAKPKRLPQVIDRWSPGI